MIVGITTTYHAPEHFERANREYAECLRAVGFLPVMLPSFPDSASIELICSSIEALVFTGGEDLGIGADFGRRDRFELDLVREAYRLGVPTLGICRGMQMMNVAMGGYLYDELPASSINHCMPEPYDQIAHLVDLRPGSHLESCFGTTLPVNSMHHQGVKRLANGLSTTGLAMDGTIEVIEADGHPFFVGVQWHPEYLPSQAPLFQALYRAASVQSRLIPTRSA